jgi:pimeloyl-ACP methyl ester carboxylesterase
LLVAGCRLEAGGERSVARDACVRSKDGVEIAFTTCGSGLPALVLVHGGLANRGFWRPSLETLAFAHQVVTLDLAGHGSSGRDRRSWTIPMFAEDVRAVADELGLTAMVLVGNSLGGPVALEAASLMPGRVLGVVGVDTFHDLTRRQDPAAVRARAAAFEEDPEGTCRKIVDELFHPGAHAGLKDWVEREMRATPAEVAAGMFEGFADYDVAAAVARAGVPIRAVNGDLWPTRVEENRAVARGFEVLVMPDAGHYAMLERPEEFGRLLCGVVASLTRSPRVTGGA